MKTVNFTEMKSGTKDEYLLLDKYEQDYINGTADRILSFMEGLNSTLEGYKITRLEHSLQTATRAYRDNAEEEMIVAALLHDIGDELAPLNHSEYAATVIKPYVSKKTHWIIENMGNSKCIIMLIILVRTKIKEISIKVINIIMMQLIFVKNGIKHHLIQTLRV